MVKVENDNASVMTSISTIVYGNLKNEIPHLNLRKGVCGPLQFTMPHAVVDIVPRNKDFPFLKVLHLISHSFVRQARYKKLYASQIMI